MGIIDTGWIGTFTGSRFYPLDPNPEDINVIDIAHHLSMICRYNGAVSRFYSVAEHSHHVSRLVPPKHALHALLHDAAEAYIGDMIRPLKENDSFTGGGRYHLYDDLLTTMILQKFGVKITGEGQFSVSEADRAILVDEGRALMASAPDYIPKNAPNSGVTIECWSPQMAERKFLERFRELCAE